MRWRTLRHTRTGRRENRATPRTHSQVHIHRLIRLRIPTRAHVCVPPKNSVMCQWSFFFLEREKTLCDHVDARNMHDAASHSLLVAVCLARYYMPTQVVKDSTVGGFAVRNVTLAQNANVNANRRNHQHRHRLQLTCLTRQTTPRQATPRLTLTLSHAPLASQH